MIPGISPYRGRSDILHIARYERRYFMNLFSYDSMLSRFLYLVGDIVTLHFLWLICSLPIVTMGASTTALYYSCMKRIRTNEGYPTRNFFKSFKENFRQSTLIWIGMLIIGFIMICDLRIGMQVSGMMGKFMIVSCSVLIIPFVLVSLYIFPVQAKFENRIRDNLKNALLMSLQNFHLSLLLVLIIGTFVCLTLFFRPFIGLMIVCGIGLLAYLTSGIFVFIFRKYIPGELDDDAERSGINREFQ